MKFTIDIDCSPQEARAFFGLPDIAPMQNAVMDKMQEELLDNMKKIDPETMLKTWLPTNVDGMESMQKFWSQMAGAASGKS